MNLIQRNVELKKKSEISPWRKTAIGSWREANDASYHMFLDLEVDSILDHLAKIREKTGEKITLTHFTIKAMAIVLEKYPHMNQLIRLGRCYGSKNVDIFAHVASDPNGHDLTGVTIRNVDQKNLIDLAQEINPKIKCIKSGTDVTFQQVKKTLRFIPGMLMRPILNFLTFIQYGLNLWSPLFQTPKDPFGSALVTNLGSLGGIDMPLTPMAYYNQVPIICAMGTVREKPMVKNGQIIIAKVLTLGFTVDHRLMDGLHGSLIAKEFKLFFSEIT